MRLPGRGCPVPGRRHNAFVGRRSACACWQGLSSFAACTTRGVVRLFNAVAKAQRARREAEEGGAKRGAAEKLSRASFLAELRGQQQQQQGQVQQPHSGLMQKPGPVRHPDPLFDTGHPITPHHLSCRVQGASWHCQANPFMVQGMISDGARACIANARCCMA